MTPAGYAVVLERRRARGTCSTGGWSGPMSSRYGTGGKTKLRQLRRARGTYGTGRKTEYVHALRDPGTVRVVMSPRTCCPGNPVRVYRTPSAHAVVLERRETVGDLGVARCRSSRSWSRRSGAVAVRSTPSETSPGVAFVGVRRREAVGGLDVAPAGVQMLQNVRVWGTV